MDKRCVRRCGCFFCFGLYIIYPHSLIRKERKEKKRNRSERSKRKRKERKDGTPGRVEISFCRKVIQEKEVRRCRFRARERTTGDSKGFGEVVPEVVG